MQRPLSLMADDLAVSPSPPVTEGWPYPSLMSLIIVSDIIQHFSYLASHLEMPQTACNVS